MKYLLTTILIFFSLTFFAQNTDQLRDLAYEHKVKGEPKESIIYYEKILNIDEEDYDAKLAIARLYFGMNDYKKSLNYYNLIYKNDETDIEALNGFSKCYHKLGNTEKAILFLNKAINISPRYIQQYFYLAKIYIEIGDLKNARKTYYKILKYDNTYSEAWQGIGKMYYWENKPKTAIKFYERALILDPTNKKISDELNNIKSELKFVAASTFKYINEEEESYEITALVQKYSVSKRFNDHFSLALNTLFDNSDRNFTDKKIADTNRWFDNTWLKINWISEHNKISTFFGGSSSDSKITAYGINWTSNFRISEIKFKNSLNASYDYFYYWNKVGKNSISNSLSATYKKFSLHASGNFGVIDKLEISDYYNNLYDTSLTNNYISYGISLKYQIFSKPKTTIALNHSYMDFDYKSPLYYTPYERVFNGASISSYYSVNKFYFYLGFGYNLGREVYYEENNSGQGNNIKFKKSYLNVNNWSGDFEMGYNLSKFNFSLGLSHFDNPYYKSTNAFVSVKALL